jgi:hypothetical protein
MDCDRLVLFRTCVRAQVSLKTWCFQAMKAVVPHGFSIPTRLSQRSGLQVGISSGRIDTTTVSGCFLSALGLYIFYLREPMG